MSFTVYYDISTLRSVTKAYDIPIIPKPRDLFIKKLAIFYMTIPYLLEQCSTASQHIPFVGSVVEKGSTRELDVSLLGSFKYTHVANEIAFHQHLTQLSSIIQYFGDGLSLSLQILLEQFSYFGRMEYKTEEREYLLKISIA